MRRRGAGGAPNGACEGATRRGWEGIPNGYTKVVSDPALDAIRMTAARARRYAEEMEREPSDDQRVRRFQRALTDLGDVVHVARTHGFDADEIHLAMRGPSGRFTRG
jgi:hypothetical protein